MTSYYDDSPYPQRGHGRAPGGDGYGPDGGYESDFDPFAPEPQQPSGPRYPDPYTPEPYVPRSYAQDAHAQDPHTPDPYAQDPYAQDPYADPYAAPADPYAPPPPTGRATVGRASVRPADGYDDQYAPPRYGDGGYADDGFDPFASGDPAPPVPTGRAGVAPAAGRATVGRATVPGQVGPGGPNGPGSPGGPGGGPGGPGGPGGSGPGGTGPGAPGATGKKSASSKKRRRRNRILAAFATLIILTGILVVGGTYYSASVPLPTDLALPQATTINYSDGHLMARIGTVTRFELEDDQIPQIVKEAAVATEDETFYTNIGVDFKGIARAFVNNITGGNTQGASTITQQYARQAESLTQDTSYTRKIKEAAIAIKLTRTWKKDKILSAYLNTVSFGRGAYGIQAAAEAYFHVGAANLTLNQAIVLIDIIRDPNGGEYDPYNHCGKTICPTPAAKIRFNYTLDQMLKLKYITQSVHDSTVYPTNAIANANTSNSGNLYLTTPQGFIVRQVMSELIQSIDPTTKKPYVDPNTGAPAFTEYALENGGYTITTTINETAENAAIASADFAKPTSPGYKTVPTGTDGSLVSIDPSTGRIIAYYGGPNGTGLDYAGVELNLNLNLGSGDPPPSSSAVGPAAVAAMGLGGAHRDPGSSMKTITMATALSQHYGLDSYWYGDTTRTRQGEGILNTGKQDACPDQPLPCPMWEGLKLSTNTMYYGIAMKVGVGNIINMAQELGVQHIWNDTQQKRYDLTPGNGIQVEHTGDFGYDLGFGQLGIDLLDLAHAEATIANNGKVETAHFVKDVSIPGQKSFYREPIAGTQIPDFTPEMAHDEQWAMQQIMTRGDEQYDPNAIHTGGTNELLDNRPAAGKTGTWEFNLADSRDNSVSAFSGYTAPGTGQLCTSVWVGSTGNVEQKLVYLNSKTGKPIYPGGKTEVLDGALMAAPIWTQYMDAALKVSAETDTKNGPTFGPAPITQFNGRDNTGDKPGEAPSPIPTISPSTGPSGGPTGGTGGPQNLPAPQNFQASPTGDTTIQLNWDAIPGLQYRLYRESGTNTVLVGAENPGYTDTGLNPGTLYTYTLTAYDGLGDTSPVVQSQATTSGAAPPPSPSATPTPDAPGALTANNLTPGQISVAWNASTGATGYQVTVTHNGTQVVSQMVSTPAFMFNSTKGFKYKIIVVALGPGGVQSDPSTTNSTGT